MTFGRFRKILAVVLSTALLTGAVCLRLFSREESDGRAGTIATKREQEAAEALFRRYFEGDRLPFSFRIGQEQITAFDDAFTVTRGQNGLSALHKETGLKVDVIWECDFEYAEMEWQISIENTGTETAPVISELYAVDLTLSGSNPCLNHSMGDVVDDPYSYAAFDTPLADGMRMSFEPGCGKSTGHQRPYYRLTTEEGGLILALGWQGRWKMSFEAMPGQEGGSEVSVRGGQYELCAALEPGEKIITPSVVLIKFEGSDKFRQINLWRRWFYDCAAIRNERGELFGTQISYGPSMSVTPDQNEENMVAELERYLKNYRNTLYWIDAGWYPIYGGQSLPVTNSYWRYTGTWRIDTKRFPTKFRKVKETMAEGTKLMLWFEPERVTLGTELYERKELLLTGNGAEKYAVLLDMGNPEAVRVAAERVVGIMKEAEVDIYRQDFNIDPWSFWHLGDLDAGENRLGMTENRYVRGLMSYYRTILAHTDNPLDMCASGGMRSDISVMKFSINMTLTDTDFSELTLHQNIRLCYNEWFSMYYGPGSEDPYSAASTLSYVTSASGQGVWDQIDHLFLGDYYPLTEHSTEEDAWCGYEFFDNRYREGFVVMIRRPDSETSSHRQKLYGLEPDTKYLVTELFGGKSTVKSGEELMTEGLGIWLSEGSAAIYRLKAGEK